MNLLTIVTIALAQSISSAYTLKDLVSKNPLTTSRDACIAKCIINYGLRPEVCVYNCPPDEEEVKEVKVLKIVDIVHV